MAAPRKDSFRTLRPAEVNSCPDTNHTNETFCGRLLDCALLPGLHKASSAALLAEKQHQRKSGDHEEFERS